MTTGANRALDRLVTESHRSDLADLDQRSTRELVDVVNREDARVPAAVAEAAPALATAIDAAVDRLRVGGRLIYAGAGTAGRMGVIDAVECGPTFNTDRVIALMAGGVDAVATASESVEDRFEDGAGVVTDAAVGTADVVVVVSASGRTPYALGAAEAARAAGALTVGVSGNPDAELSGLVDHPIEVVAGPEVITGSTRLKAGTAQKLVLNALSTIVMVRLGKTYGNLMVDVRATNEKLRRRAERVVELATGADPDTVAAALGDADGDVKTAVVMLLADTDAARAAARLADAGGRVRDALAGAT